MLIMVAMQGGSSGAFLQSIIAQWITGDTSDMQFGINGDCHDYKRRYEAEYIQSGWQQFPISDWTLLKRKMGIAKSQPIVVWSRCLEDWDLITQHHSPWHHIFIHVEWMEKLWTATNHYYKMLSGYSKGDGSPTDLGLQLALENRLLDSTSHPIFYNHTETYQLIQCQLKFEVDHSRCFQYSADCARRYPGQKTDINFLDIMTRPDRIFARLKPIIGYDCGKTVFKNYAGYLAKQYELIQTKAPWLHDRLRLIKRAIDWCNNQ